MLPVNYEYIMCKADPQYVTDSLFTAEFAINVKTKEGIQTWLEEFSTLTQTIFNIERTQRVIGKRVIFKVRLLLIKIM